MLDLTGRVALVTGGGGEGGIGQAICAKLCDYGAIIAVTDIDKPAAIATAAMLVSRGGRAVAFEHDVSRADHAIRVVREVNDQLGPIDILVNNAGISHTSAFLEIAEADWDRVLGTNLKGVFLTSKAVLPDMVERRCGRVINLSSIVGKLGMARLAAYSASKSAIIGLTQALAAEFACHDITVNCVCPGVVETPLHNSLVNQLVEGPGGPSSREAANEWMKNQIPLGRPQLTVDVAEMVAFLASDLARNMTAASYHVDGGLMPR